MKKHRVVPLTPTGDLPSLVAAFAGGPVKGSWWGHPKGVLIYNATGKLIHSGEAVLVKLVRGKETFVHRSLWPELTRVVTDAEWRKRAATGLGRDAHAILETVAWSGSARMDEIAEGATKARRRALADARLELEKRLLVRAEDLHTDRGAHTTILRPWDGWATRDVAKRAAKLTLEGAIATIEAACRGEPTALAPAPEKKKKRPRAR